MLLLCAVLQDWLLLEVFSLRLVGLNESIGRLLKHAVQFSPIVTMRSIFLFCNFSYSLSGHSVDQLYVSRVCILQCFSEPLQFCFPSYFVLEPSLP
jgi:hypothetical protein